MSHTPEREADAAAYALGALDDHEIAAFRRHLNTCVVCQADVEGFQETTSVLPMSAPQFSAPKHLRRSVMDAVREDARATALAAPAARRTTGWNSASTWSPDWKRVALPRYHAGLVGGVTALVLVIVVIVVGVTASGSSSVTKPRVSATPTARVYAASVGSAEVVISHGRAQLIVHQLKQLGASSTYEVWLKPAKGAVEPTNALFNVSATGSTAVSIPNSLAGIKSILVTRERAGGSATPSSVPLVSAQIS